MNEKQLDKFVMQQYKKKQTGNYAGRPKGSLNFKTVLRRVLNTKYKSIDPITKKEVEKRIQHWIVLAWVQKAMKGDMQALSMMLDRLDGVLPKSAINIKNDNSSRSQSEVRMILEDVSDEEIDRVGRGIFGT